MKWLDTPSKILTFALAIAALTWTAIQIWDWYERPAEELTAEISNSRFVLPPTVESNMLSLVQDKNQVQMALIYLKEYDSQWLINIHNSGQKSLSDVTLRLPFSCLVKINYEDKPSQVLNTSGMVNLGTLTPEESLNVTCWSSSQASSYEANLISIIHSSGIGKIKRTVTVQDSKLLFIVEHPFMTLYFLFLLIYFLNRISTSSSNSSPSKKGKASIQK